MKNKLFRSLPVLLSVLLAASAVSCGSEPTAPADDTTGADASVTEAETEAPFNCFEGLPQNDYEGKDFRMLIRCFERWIGDMYVEEATGDIVDDSIFERNSRVSEYFNINFVLIESSHSNYETDAKNVILAGDDAYELVVPHARAGAGPYANAGLMLDWNEDLPYVDLTKPWWDQDCQKSLSINGKLYCMEGDLSYCSLGAADVMLFNKTAFAEYDLEAPYQQVLDGTWTLDKWETMVRGTSKDLNGDSKMDIDSDFFGYVTQYWVGPIEAFTASGLRIMDKDENDIPKLCMMNERTLDVFDRYFAILDSDDAYCDTKGNSYAAGFLKTFIDGRALFCDMNLADVVTMRTMDADFGIVPWPKYSEDDEYLTCVDAGTSIFCVPITVADPEMVSLVLESLSAYGYDKVLPAFYEVTLKSKASRDNESAAMLDIIKNSRVFDIAYFNTELGSGGIANQFNAFTTVESRDFTSWYASKETPTIAAIEKIVNSEAYQD